MLLGTSWPCVFAGRWLNGLSRWRWRHCFDVDESEVPKIRLCRVTSYEPVASYVPIPIAGEDALVVVVVVVVEAARGNVAVVDTKEQPDDDVVVVCEF